MITDVFNQNIIHIAGGNRNENKYMYFQFNQTFINQLNPGLICVCVCMCVMHFCFFNQCFVIYGK